MSDTIDLNPPLPAQADSFEGPGVAGDMVELARFLDPSEAQMVKGMLDAAGIEAFLDGENANALYPGVFRAIVLVRKSDEVAARGLLQQTEQADAENLT